MVIAVFLVGFEISACKDSVHITEMMVWVRFVETSACKCFETSAYKESVEITDMKVWVRYVEISAYKCFELSACKDPV